MNMPGKKFSRKIKGDILIITIILIIVFLFFLVSCWRNAGQKDSEIVILQDGKEVYRYVLSEDRTVTVFDKDQGYNLILVSGGTVKVTDADCPDRLCVRQREISRNGESIICLPHKLVILIESQKESDLDAVTN